MDNSLENLYNIGLSQLQIREIIEALAGFKLSRLNISEFQIEELKKWCIKNGLFYSISKYYIEEHIYNEGKGRWSNSGRKNSISGIKFFYLSKNQDDVISAKIAEEKSNFESFSIMGDLLKIPKCCQKFYNEKRSKAVHNYYDEYAPLIEKNTSSIGRIIDWKSNYLSQYFGYSLIHYYPCKFNCIKTKERASKIFTLIQDHSKPMAGAFEANMKGLMLVEDTKIIHMIEGKREGNQFYYHSANVKSTQYTRLTKKLKGAGGSFCFNLDTEIPSEKLITVVYE